MAKILSVDDDVQTSKLITIALTKAGHTVYTASNGEEGIEKVLEVEPDLIISDVEMPVMNGYEFVKTLRESFLTKNIPIIMLSGLSRDEERVAGLQTGADDYLAKPVNPQELQIKVDLLLSRTAELRKLRDEEAKKKRGKTIVFFGVKGGVGTTTLTINTAIAFKSLGKEVCACDMNFDFGVIHFLLNAKYDKNILHLLKENPLDMTRELLESYLATHSDSNLKILISPEQIQTDITNEVKRIKYTIKSLSTCFDITIIDTGSKINPLSLLLFDMCDYLVLCVNLDVLSFYNLKKLSTFLKENNINFEKVKIVVNNINQYSDLRVDTIKNQFPFSLIENIQYDGPNFMKAINDGKPYISMFPKSKSTIQIKNIATKVIEMNQ